MRIHEIILNESYFDDLLVAIQDLISLLISKERSQVSTRKFRRALAKQGFETTMSELVQAVEASGFATSVDEDVITFGDTNDTPMPDINMDPPEIDPPELSNAPPPPPEQSEVSRMAGDQAIKDIKAEL